MKVSETKEIGRPDRRSEREVLRQDRGQGWDLTDRWTDKDKETD